MILDDDGGLVGLLRERIRKAGYRPIWAHDAHEALAAITHEKPALVIIRTGVPRLCGLALEMKLDRSTALAGIPRIMFNEGGAFRKLESTSWPVSLNAIDLTFLDASSTRRPDELDQARVHRQPRVAPTLDRRSWPRF